MVGQRQSINNPKLQRNVWFGFLITNDYGGCSAKPREQKRRPNGTWTKGRPIALKRLYFDLDDFPYLSEQDRAICKQIESFEYKSGWYTNVDYNFNDKYLWKLIGHPLIFLNDGTTRVELVKGKPELSVTQKGRGKQTGKIYMELIPRPSQYDADHYALKETDTRVKLIKMDEEYHRIAEISGKQVQTSRDLTHEIQQVTGLLQSCPTLQQYESGHGEWILDEVEDCLEVLSELEDIRDQIILEWPEGRTFKLAGNASLNQFSLNIKQDKDWFAATGKVKIDKQLVLDMQQLLTLMDNSPGRFVEIKDKQFLALTHEFRKRLQELNRYSENYGKGIRFHPLAALALEGMTNDVGQLRSDATQSDRTTGRRILADGGTG